MFEDLRGFLEKSGKRRPLFRIGPDMWAYTAGLGLQLQLEGRGFAVEKGAVFMFTDEFAADGTEDALEHHTERMLALETEFLRRFPQESAPDPLRTRAGSRREAGQD